MPVPKRRHSKRRTAIKRNAHFFRSLVQTKVCETCGAQKRPHRKCEECGN